MRTFTKVACVLALLCCSTVSFAQQFGVKAGMNLSKIYAKDNDENYTDDYKLKSGFLIGGTFEMPITEVFKVETGFQFTTKGFREHEDDSYNGIEYEYKFRAQLYYAEIPVNAKFVFKAGSVNVYGFAGPYFGLGIYGVTRYEFTSIGESDSDTEDVQWGSDEQEDDIKRLDVGLQAGGGVEIKSFQIGVTYQFGLNNISAYTDNGSTIKNRVIGLAVGYKFGSLSGVK